MSEAVFKLKDSPAKNLLLFTRLTSDF